MIHMRAFLPKNSQLKLQALLRWSKLKQEQVSEAILVTKDTILGFIKRQAEKGNWQDVQQVLKGKPMTKASNFLLEELRNNVISNLIIRLGLRRVVAVGLAAVLLPVLIAKLSGELLEKFRQK